ncbi:MAG TPA: hypothetical protein VH833_10475 [Gemmatimonadales bacterium]|jgi:hypothetical protein
MSDVPAGWGAVATRSATTAVVAFVVLQAKEMYDAGRFDTPATAVDAVLIAVGIFLVNAIYKLAKS